MRQGFVKRLASFVTTHNRLVILMMLVLTAGVAFGVTQEQDEVDQGIDDDALGDTEVMQAAEYLEERYGEEEGANLTTYDAYVITDDGSALTRESLLAALEYQQAVLEEPTASDHLEEVSGAPNRVGATLAGDADADLATQHDAIASADDDELEAAVTETFADGEAAGFYLPATYEPGAAAADAVRMTFTFDAGDPTAEGAVHPELQETLYDTADGYDEQGVFTDVNPAWMEASQLMLEEAAWLIIPAILAVLLVVLGFAYRDLTDVVLGFTGTVLALLWTAGLMGWMGLLNQTTAIVAPVLVAALSIDFGFHVFMRYREERRPGEAVRAAFGRSTAAVSVAFALVTVTAAIGFLSNQLSPVPMIRDLGVAITLGVVAALVIFTTLVPALKVSADGLWERVGFDRRKTALGKGPHLSRVLASGAVLAQRGALAVLALALVVGVAGGLAFAELDRQAYQQTEEIDDVPEWQTQLPGPMAVESHEADVIQHLAYVQDSFQADQGDVTEGATGFTTMLVEGDVATADGIATVAAGHERAVDADPDVVFEQNGEVRVLSPLSMMEEIAAVDEEFAAVFEAADTNGDGVPDTDVEALYDELFEAAPEQAAQVIERTDDGSYESLLVQVPAQQGAGTERADVMDGIADEMADEAGQDVTAVGMATLEDAELGEIAEGIVLTLLVAMVGVLLALAVVYRLVHGSLALGAVTVVPIALALGLVFGGMYLVGQPLTMLTALLVSITVGLGIDYNIHVSDRFAHELERGHNTATALREAVTGTGGALLGSALTSGSAFSLLVLLPEPQLTSFGIITALALGVSFLLSVFVLPSLLWLWARHSTAGAAPSSASDPLAGD